jgi:hypothetical protein
MDSFPSYQEFSNNDLFYAQPEEDEFRVKHARKEKLYFYWEPENFGLWSSPNMPYLRKPVHRPSEDGDQGLLRDHYRRPRKTRWLDSIQPFLGFWPLRPEWTGPFSCLNLIPGRLPVIWWKAGLTHHLHSDVAMAWQLLEGKLVQLGTDWSPSSTYHSTVRVVRDPPCHPPIRIPVSAAL